MKTCLVAAGWAGLLLGPAVLVVHAKPAVAHADGAADFPARTPLAWKNARRAEVLAQLGPPGATLSHDIWIYWNARSHRPQVAAEFDTLVLAFAHDRVIGIKLTSAAVVREHIARQEKRAPAALLRQPLYATGPAAR